MDNCWLLLLLLLGMILLLLLPLSHKKEMVDRQAGGPPRTIRSRKEGEKERKKEKKRKEKDYKNKFGNFWRLKNKNKIKFNMLSQKSLFFFCFLNKK